MTTTELDEVMELLGRILLDPVGYSERLFKQAVLQWAEGIEQPHPVIPGEADTNGLATLLDYVLRPSGPDVSPAHPNEVPAQLASALGACSCWGQNKKCPICAGEGSSAWVDPDPDLFQQYVGPAADRLATIWDTPSHDDLRAQNEHPRPTTLLDYVLRPDRPDVSPEHPNEVPAQLASALGACSCWGQNKKCPICAGEGSSAWVDPNPGLFQQYVGPAADRLATIWDTPSHDDLRAQNEHPEQPHEGSRP